MTNTELYLALNELVSRFLEDGGDPSILAESLREIADDVFEEDEDVATDPAGGAAVAAAGDGDAADILFAADAAAFAPGEAWGAAAGPEPTADGAPASEFIAPDDDPIAATTPADEALAPARDFALPAGCGSDPFAAP